MDDRLKKTADPARRDRAMEDRSATERREMSDAQRVEMFVQQFQDAALPNIPDIPGYHVCWLTTTNSRDSIQRRLQMGYEPVKPEDVPHWQYITLKTGEWAGFIGVSEMLACKIRLDLYNKIMATLHHDMPRAEEERMAETARNIRNQLLSNGGNPQQVVEEEGFSELRAPVPRPQFEG